MKEDDIIIKHPNIIMGLDIGSSKVCAVICEIDKQNHITFRGVGTSVTSGIEKGKITSAQNLKHSIKHAMDRAVISAGVKPSRVLTNLPLHRMVVMRNTGVKTIQNQEYILNEDVTDAIKKAKQVPKLTNHTVLHAIPLAFRVDGVDVSNPTGKQGTHLEIDSNIILADAEGIRQLRDCLTEFSLKVSGFLYDPLSLGYLLLTEEERNKGALLLDIGCQFTKSTLFRKGKLQQSQLLPIGGDTITSDLSKCLNISTHEAERLKIIYGNVCLDQVGEEESIQMSKGSSSETIKQRYLCQIIEARVDELLELASREIDIKKADKIVLCGEGAQLRGITEYVARRFGKPIRFGLPDEMQNKNNQLSYAVALGNIMYTVSIGAISFISEPKSEGFSSKVKSWFGFSSKDRAV